MLELVTLQGVLLGTLIGFSANAGCQEPTVQKAAVKGLNLANKDLKAVPGNWFQDESLAHWGYNILNTLFFGYFLLNDKYQVFCLIKVYTLIVLGCRKWYNISIFNYELS